jgi:hypothetical protein
MKSTLMEKYNFLQRNSNVNGNVFRTITTLFPLYLSKMLQYNVKGRNKSEKASFKKINLSCVSSFRKVQRKGKYFRYSKLLVVTVGILSIVIEL